MRKDCVLSSFSFPALAEARSVFISAAKAAFCTGVTAFVFVVLFFVAGALAPKSGTALEWVFGKLETDMTPHFTKNVTPAQKAEFAAEMKTLRASAKSGKLKLDKTQTFLKLCTEVDSDEKIDPAEADKLIAAVRDVNRGAK